MPEVAEKPLLCTHTAQVPNFELNPIAIKDLSLWITSIWLDTNGYTTISDKLKSCGSTFAHFRCADGHEKYVRLRCKMDYCPKCGKKWSAAHKRRAVRAMDRLLYGPVVGYMIFTLPEEISSQQPDRDTLSALSKKAWEIVKRNFDTEGGMVRTHLMGEKNEKLHIHFNVLFPLRKNNDIGKVSKEKLATVRKEWTDFVNGYFELGHKHINSFYTFVWEYGKRIHKVKYVMRPIVTGAKFLSLTAEDKHYVLSLRGWHNTRWFGKLANSQYKKYLKEQGIDYSLRQEQDIGLSKRCPICKNKFKFVEMTHKSLVPRGQLRCIDSDVLVDFALHSYLTNNSPCFWHC